MKVIPLDSKIKKLKITMTMKKDNFMSQTFERIHEAGYADEAKAYLDKHLLEGEL